MKTDFKVYPRKIHVSYSGPLVIARGKKWEYAWSTNAYKTCREAVAAGKSLYPEFKFKANFAKD